MGTKVFSDRLRGLRDLNSISQRQVANVLGISQAGYQCYESGTKMPVAAKLPTLADFFNVSIDYLLGRTDEPRLPSKAEWLAIDQLRARKAAQN